MLRSRPDQPRASRKCHHQPERNAAPAYLFQNGTFGRVREQEEAPCVFDASAELHPVDPKFLVFCEDRRVRF